MHPQAFQDECYALLRRYHFNTWAVRWWTGPLIEGSGMFQKAILAETRPFEEKVVFGYSVVEQLEVGKARSLMQHEVAHVLNGTWGWLPGSPQKQYPDPHGDEWFNLYRHLGQVWMDPYIFQETNVVWDVEPTYTLAEMERKVRRGKAELQA